ncbi:unnamed protein product [Urochloa decumbens]|uniref:PGG domain-containing protein n=1 Tax=Urochloa decumbens TaxID=240449 RepID=A0ABC9AL93_9POAL
MPSDSNPGKNNKGLHKEVLGGIVTANGFLTGAVFLSINGTVTPTSGIPSNCTAGNDITLNLFLFQIWSLGFYFLSSLIATATKLLVVYFETDTWGRQMKYTTPPPPLDDDQLEHQQMAFSWLVHQRTLQPEFHHSSFQSGHQQDAGISLADRRGRNTAEMLSHFVRPLMVSSVFFSALGSLLLLLSMINMVQIKLGLLSCGNTLVVITVLGIGILILAGLVTYLSISWFFLKRVK